MRRNKLSYTTSPYAFLCFGVLSTVLFLWSVGFTTFLKKTKTELRDIFYLFNINTFGLVKFSQYRFLLQLI